jgi:hypothetical protein
MRTVKVDLRGSFGYPDERGRTRYYGPGKGVEVPELLAKGLGLTESVQAPVEPPQPPAEAPQAPTARSFASVPHRADLEANSITTLDAVPTNSEALVALPGIGKTKAAAILEYLGGDA